MSQAINKTRRARNTLRKKLGLTMKQLKKRGILKKYDYADGAFTLKADSPGGRAPSSGHIFNKLGEAL